MNIKLERANGNHMRSNVCFDNFDDEMLYLFVCLYFCVCMYLFISVYFTCVFHFCVEQIPCIGVCIQV